MEDTDETLFVLLRLLAEVDAEVDAELDRFTKP